MYSYIDLFSGAGGFSLGFSEAGFENIFSVEYMPDYAETYKRNFPKHKLIVKNISEIGKEEILENLGSKKVDVIIGGPPCQGFSMAGNIGRKFTDDPRNRLFTEFVRFVSIIEPKFFVMENVARLYTHNKSQTRNEIIQEFKRLGYFVEAKILNAEDYGVPQIRNRVIFIGSRITETILFPNKVIENYLSVKDAIDKYPKLESGESSNIKNHVAMKHSEQMLEKMSFVKDGGSRVEIPEELRPKTGDARKYIRYDSSKPSVCITGDMRKVFHYSQNRALTVRELAAIQSFPDDFEFFGSSISQQQQVGNAVPPKMAFAIANTIKRMLDDYQNNEKIKESNFIEYEYPTINYIGNKEKIIDWIFNFIPSDVKSIFDGFSGGSVFGYFGKRKGYKVFSNDILNINYQISKALIENKSEKLNDEDISLIFSGSPFVGFFTENYANRFYFEGECKELDLYRFNIEKLKSSYKKALAYTILRRAMIRKMPYSRFNIPWNKIVDLRNEELSYEKYGRKRAYHNQSFKFHFLKELDSYNNSIFDNGQENLSFNENIFDIIENINADLIYLDPPYCGTMSNYFSFYGLLDELILNKKIEGYENSFIDKKHIVDDFHKLFSKTYNYKYILVSYNSRSFPDLETLLDILNNYSKKIEIKEIEYAYKVTGKLNKNSSKECLFLLKN